MLLTGGLILILTLAESSKASTLLVLAEAATATETKA